MMIMTTMIMNQDDKDLLVAFLVADPPHCQLGGGLPIDWSEQWTQWPCRPFSPLLDAPYFTINQMSHRRRQWFPWYGKKKGYTNQGIFIFVANTYRLFFMGGESLPAWVYHSAANQNSPKLR